MRKLRTKLAKTCCFPSHKMDEEAPYILNYFDSRGLAEPIRFILSYGRAKWEDRRIPVTCYPAVLPDDVRARMPFGQVPVLEFKGQQLSQCHAIERFLARKFNLVGESGFEEAKCDEIVDATKDLLQLWINYWKNHLVQQGDELAKAEALKETLTSSKERYFSKFNSILEENDGHFVGKGLTWADIYAAYHIDNIQSGNGLSFTDDYPALKALIQTVYDTPGIKEWIEKRPETMF